MRYYISDLHFYHESMNNWMDKRGFANAVEMNEFMIQQWNARVHKNDEVVILGDLSLGKAQPTEDIAKRLNGKKYLIVGNHDKFLGDASFDRSLFKDIAHYREMNDNGRKVILCHYPIFCYNGQFREDQKGKPKVFMLHGHVHNTQDAQLLDTFVSITRKTVRPNGAMEQSKTIPCNLINCFCMYSNYVPWTLDDWIAFDETRRASKIS